MQKTDRVAVTFFGDGASNEGTFHEAMNLAALWKLPVIFVCENNGFGISVPTWQSTSVENISDRAKGYGIPGVTVDGNDVYAVYEAAEHAIARAKAGEGPTLIECKTYRHLGHWTGDPQLYRSRETVEEWKRDRDPIKRMRERLIASGHMKEAELDKIEAEAKAAAEAAAEFAINSPEPDTADVLKDVFYEEAETR